MNRTKVPNQDTIAWDLLDEVRSCLNIAEINRVSMTMADRDYPAVIELLLSRAAAQNVQLPVELGSRLREWEGFYAAQPISARLRQYMNDVSADSAR